MNTTNPNDLFYDIECPDPFIALTALELGIYLEDLE